MIYIKDLMKLCSFLQKKILFKLGSDPPNGSLILCPVLSLYSVGSDSL